MTRKAIIIGAGPAGLTAAYELLQRTDIRPVIYEATDEIGGLARTIQHAGNRMDIGGHRFFSKSDRVMDWWQQILPIAADQDGDFEITYQRRKRSVRAAGTADDDGRVMLVRPRVSRILFRRQFFPYPLSLSPGTLAKLGLPETIRIGLSYLRARLTPRREESLEDFFVNRFGDRLYRTFFKDYTEKVWGVDCDQIEPEWGAQRIKGLSVTQALLHALKGLFGRDESISQKDSETSLIEQFLYPRLGPGQMWEEVARQVCEQGGELHFGRTAVGFETEGENFRAVRFRDEASGEDETVQGDFVFSTMPMRDLVRGLDADVPAPVREVSDGLIYRDFITMGLLVKELRIRGDARPGMPEGLVPDNWIYVQEPDVRIGRLQVFNNWSPDLVDDPTKVWLGLEYFCDEGDDLWSMADDAFKAFAIEELERIGVIDSGDVLESTVVRVPKTYPAYFGTYDRFDELRRYLDGFENLFLIGRNGMHRYNNQDHSMLTAMTAVDQLAADAIDKDAIWAVNAEGDYHEEG